jgi:hypothetical protein
MLDTDEEILASKVVQDPSFRPDEETLKAHS